MAKSKLAVQGVGERPAQTDTVAHQDTPHGNRSPPVGCAAGSRTARCFEERPRAGGVREN